MPIKRITECFVTSDGKIHTSLEEAERHESRYRDKKYFDEVFIYWRTSRHAASSFHEGEMLFNALREKGMTFIIK